MAPSADGIFPLGLVPVITGRLAIGLQHVLTMVKTGSGYHT